MSATSAKKSFRFYNHTEAGPIKQENEDYLGYFETMNGDVFMVCDGMGGHVGGAIAARLAVDSIRDCLQEVYHKSPFEALEISIKHANKQIFKEASNNETLKGMGTTCAVLLIRDNLVYYAHVGDSRIYELSRRKLKQLTKDHSVVQELIDQGLLKIEESHKHPNKHELTRVLGIEEHVEVAVCPAPITPIEHMLFLLCTDGLIHAVKDYTLEEVLNANLTLQQKAQRLTQVAKQLGGQDNITLQVVEFHTLTPQQVKKKVKIFSSIIFVLFAVIVGILYLLNYNYQKTTKAEEEKELIEANLKKERDKARKDSLAAIDTEDPITIYHILKKKESFAKLTTKYNVPQDSLEVWNPQVTDPRKIAAGDSLVIKIQRYYVTQKGDNMDSIVKKFARWKKYGLNRKILLQANRTPQDSLNGTLEPGKKIIIPLLKKNTDY